MTSEALPWITVSMFEVMGDAAVSCPPSIFLRMPQLGSRQQLVGHVLEDSYSRSFAVELDQLDGQEDVAQGPERVRRREACGGRRAPCAAAP